MDLAEIVEPLGEFMTWTFDNLLLPLTKGNAFNIVAIVLIVFGLVYWLKLQKDYNVKADKEGSVR